MENSFTTIKLSKETKARLDHLKLYPRETYEEIMQRFLEILNIARLSPEKARAKLFILDKQRKSNFKLSEPSQSKLKSEKAVQKK